MPDIVSDYKVKNEWNNQDLKTYYENVPIQELKEWTKIGGFYKCCDIDVIRSYINKAESILDVGAGYGRAIENILSNGYKNKITAIERCEKFCNYMHKFYDKISQVSIIKADVMEYKFNNKYDLILLLWSNISEYPHDKQLHVLQKLKSALSSGGIMVVETLDHETMPKNSTTFNKQTYMVESDYGTAYGYIPSAKQVYKYAITLDFKNIKQISYVTTTQRKRLMSIFS